MCVGVSNAWHAAALQRQSNPGGQPALDKLTPWEDHLNSVRGYEASMSKRHPCSKGALLGMAVTHKQEEGLLGQVRGSVIVSSVFLRPPATCFIVQ